jgi:hypothetical protein
MCTSYESNNPHETFDAFSIFPAPNFDYEGEIYKGYVAPIFWRIEDGWSTDPATFGMVPRKRILFGFQNGIVLSRTSGAVDM